MINLRAVGVIGEAELEAARIEVLIHAGCVEPAIADAAGKVEVEVLHAEVIGFIVELSAELLFAQLAESRYGISDVTGTDGTL